MKTKRADSKPVTVPFGATPAGQPLPVEDWANRTVWTDRMLDALRKGVRGGKWHALHGYRRFSCVGFVLESDRSVSIELLDKRANDYPEIELALIVKAIGGRLYHN